LGVATRRRSDLEIRVCATDRPSCSGVCVFLLCLADDGDGAHAETGRFHAPRSRDRLRRLSAGSVIIFKARSRARRPPYRECDHLLTVICDKKSPTVPGTVILVAWRYLCRSRSWTGPGVSGLTFGCASVSITAGAVDGRGAEYASGRTILRPPVRRLPGRGGRDARSTAGRPWSAERQIDLTGTMSDRGRRLPSSTLSVLQNAARPVPSVTNLARLCLLAAHVDCGPAEAAC